MKNILLLIILFSFILTGCNNRNIDNKIVSEKTNPLPKDSSLIRVNKISNDPFRDINNFDIKTGNLTIDTLKAALSKNSNVQTTTKNDLCSGDNCTSFKTFTNPKTGITFHFFKGDNGEYGFSNDQFVLEDDSLSIVRNFNVAIETWPTDTSGTLWVCEETIFYFYGTHVKILERKTYTKDLYEFDYTLKNEPFEIQSLFGSNLYETKSEELKKLLTIVSDE